MGKIVLVGLSYCFQVFNSAAAIGDFVHSFNDNVNTLADVLDEAVEKFEDNESNYTA